MVNFSSRFRLLSFLIIFVTCVSCELTEDEVDALIAGENRRKEFERMERLRARSGGSGLGGRSGRDGRRSLPAGDVFTGFSAYPLACGGTYDISKEGYKFFKMNSKNSACYHAFVGSVTAGCRVGVLCDGVITLLGPSSTDSGCDREYMKLSDGTLGLMIGCGSFKFKKIPRYARNNGTDIYLYFKGSSPNACVAFCIEDLDSGHDVNEPKPVTKSKLFQGFQMEESCLCGKRKDYGRVVGGDDALKNEFPWIGAVVIKGRSGRSRQPFCGGTLISDRYFVSAAHCFQPENMQPHQVQLIFHAHLMDKRFSRYLSRDDQAYDQIPGWSLPDETDESEESVRVDVEEIINHPLFSIQTYDWDVAVLKLKNRINLATSKVKPCCLPLISEVLEYRDGDTMFNVAGWGRPAEDAPAGSRLLQKLDVPYVNHQDCLDYTLPTLRHLCAGFPRGQRDACSGDSGGPLIYKFKPQSNQYLLAGVVSAGEGCARRGKVGLYTNVKDVVQWIYHQTSDGVFCRR